MEKDYYVIRVPMGLQKAQANRAGISRQVRTAGHPPGGKSLSNPRTSIDGKQAIYQGPTPPWPVVFGPVDSEEMRAYIQEHSSEWIDQEGRAV